jgi:hypothetical protein
MRDQFRMTEGWERSLTDEEAEAFWGGRQSAGCGRVAVL